MQSSSIWPLLGKVVVAIHTLVFRQPASQWHWVVVNLLPLRIENCFALRVNRLWSNACCSAGRCSRCGDRFFHFSYAHIFYCHGPMLQFSHQVWAAAERFDACRRLDSQQLRAVEFLCCTLSLFHFPYARCSTGAAWKKQCALGVGNSRGGGLGVRLLLIVTKTAKEGADGGKKSQFAAKMLHCYVGYAVSQSVRPWNWIMQWSWWNCCGMEALTCLAMTWGMCL